MRELIFSARKQDFRVDTFCSGGPGGQHQNKTQSGVRITHIATGLSAECREMRNQGQNKTRAFRKLAMKLVRFATQKQSRNIKISDETVRTYHEPDNRVKDHKSGFVSTYREVVNDGELSEMIQQRRIASFNGEASVS